MGQIVKRKKKGRPSKADLALRMESMAKETESDIRRSLRRRNVKYNIDYDDYLDEEEEEEDGEEMKKEKRVKLLKLNHNLETSSPNRARLVARGRHGVVDEEEERDEEAEEDEDEEEGEKRSVKKRRINDTAYEEEDEDEDVDLGEDDEVRESKGGTKGRHPTPGRPRIPSSEIPLPDKKPLELILDKLQKKDIYAVYAEPVDPEELPDYHDIIDHPMDFATIRKKLANGSYLTLGQFESDVFLLCSNAMQYNSSDTVYHKQARTIQELARKKFEKVRILIERLEKEAKSEPKTKSSILEKKQMRKTLNRSTQEPVGSDFSSGATLANVTDIQNGSITIQGVGFERPNITDGLVESYSPLVDYNLEKLEELSSGKSLLPKFGRKPSGFDENRRATYTTSIQPVVTSDSIYTTFEDEIKQFVAVGLHAEYSYARSLARFAATLGPVAWKVASQRIEQALPAGCKFGRGWVGEYEPLPTPVLMIETCMQKQSPLFMKLHGIIDLQNDDMSSKTPVPLKEQPASVSISAGKTSLFRSATIPESIPSLVASPGTISNIPVNAFGQQKNPHSRTFVEPQNRVSKQVELNHLPLSNQNKDDLISEKSNDMISEKRTSISREMPTRNMTLPQSEFSNQVEDDGAVRVGFPNGKTKSRSLESRMVSPSSNNIPNQDTRATYFPHGQEQGLSDPVQLMRMLSKNAQKPTNSLSQSQVEAPPVSSVRRDDSSNATAAAARAWMSIGAGGFKQETENSNSPNNQISAESLYNPARESYSQYTRVRPEFPPSTGLQYQSERNNFPRQGFAPQPLGARSETSFQNRPFVFPQLVPTDLSRFQVQSSWRSPGLHAHQKQKNESLPPDLNISFPSPGSPAKQSLGVMVDSQQPDLALQL